MSGVYTLPGTADVGPGSNHPDVDRRPDPLDLAEFPETVMAGEVGRVIRPDWKPYRYGASPLRLRPSGPLD